MSPSEREEFAMDRNAIIALVVVIVVLAVAVLVARPLLRRRRLQERFGPEYDRAVESHENRAVAERELADREKRYKQLELRDLAPEARDRYTAEWTRLQAQFVDAPEQTVTDADRLVTELMAERGYPTEGYQDQLAHLSVEHASTLGHYRDAHDVRDRVGEGGVSTEDLRNAMVHYRALFADMLGLDDDDVVAASRNTTVTDDGRWVADEPALDTDERRLADERALDADERPVADERALDADERRLAAEERRLDADEHRLDAEAPRARADAEIADAERSRSDRHRASH
jgi:hypothetical protein